MKNNRLWTLALLVLILLLSGCEPKREARTPNTGKEPFILGDYLLEEESLETLVQELGCYVELPPFLRVDHFKAELDRWGYMQNFTLSLYAYDENLKFMGQYSIWYNEAPDDDGEYLGYKVSTDYYFTPEYNENADIYYLSEQLTRIKLSEQIKLLKFSKYVLCTSGRMQPEAGTPIMDGTGGSAFPLLTLEEYKLGQSGVSDGSSGVYFYLYDSVSMVSENFLYFRFPAANPETIIGDRDYMLKSDYSIFNGTVSLTRNYGETWLELPLPEGALNETLMTYQTAAYVHRDSFFYSNESDVVAFIYGDMPQLLISRDDGYSWETIDLCSVIGIREFSRPVLNRFVRFFDDLNGYVGLGTDWSMGAGEGRCLLTTRDGGVSWDVLSLPLSGTSQILSGVAFADMETGVASFQHVYNYEDDVALYYTQDGGQSWDELNISFENLPAANYYLDKAEYIAYEGGQYHIVLSQGTKKVRFSAPALDGLFQYADYWQTVK